MLFISFFFLSLCSSKGTHDSGWLFRFVGADGLLFFFVLGGGDRGG